MHLAGRGHDVTVVERESTPGGRNGVLRQDGFTFDTGPTVFTMVDLLDDAFRAVGKRASDYVSLRLLDPAYRANFADGSRLDVWHDHARMREEIARESGVADAAAFDEFVVWLRKLYLTEMPNFIDVNYDSPLGLLRNPKAALDLVRLGGLGRLGPTIARRFRDERLHRVFSFQAMYAGLAPAQALAIYAVITYMDSIEGVWFPDGGMRAVPQAMAVAAEEAGVEIRLSSTVTKLRRDASGRATGVTLDGGEVLTADVVVCTLDLPVAYERLLPDLAPPRVVRRGKYSPSAVVWHVGVRGELPEHRGHHNIHFGHAWEEAFTDLLVSGRPMRDPSRLVTIPSLDDPTAAPEGHHSIYVLEPTPNLQVGQVDWHVEGPRIRERLLRFLQEEGYPTDIVTEKLITPLDWEADGMAAGSPFALAHTFFQSGPFRPNNVDKRVPG
ncbi:MAG: phytoene desaturase, partial [Propionibacterium sp.]|nr:phytoene desaturase [Propionibacterium sp.]